MQQGTIRRHSYPFHLIRDRDGNETTGLPTLEDEVAGMARVPIKYQGGVTARRLVVLEAYQKLCSDLFDADSGVEFGCGAYGFLHNHVIPSGVRWTQYDINPDAVNTNRKHSKKPLRRAPDVRVGDIYDMPLEDRSVNLIAGCCAFDATYNHDAAIDEVARTLRPGGTFVHMVDMLPDEIPLVLNERDERLKRGFGGDVTCGFHHASMKADDGTVTETSMVTHIYSLDYGYVRTGQYVQSRLADFLINAGFDIIENDERSTESCAAREHVNNRLKQFHFRIPEGYNHCVQNHGKIGFLYDSSHDNNLISQYLAMDVLVARKR